MKLFNTQNACRDEDRQNLFIVEEAGGYRIYVVAKDFSEVIKIMKASFKPEKAETFENDCWKIEKIAGYSSLIITGYLSGGKE